MGVGSTGFFGELCGLPQLWGAQRALCFSDPWEAYGVLENLGLGNFRGIGRFCKFWNFRGSTELSELGNFIGGINFTRFHKTIGYICSLSPLLLKYNA